MKILVIQDFLRSGGTERQSILLANAFATAGHATTLLTLGAVGGGNSNLTINGAGNTTINGAISTGNGSLIKGGAGTLTLTGASTYAGTTAATATQIQTGTAIVGVANALPIYSGITLGDGSTGSGVLQLGTAAAAFAQTLTSLNTSGTGTTNAVVGGFTAASTLTLNIAAGTTNTFGGKLGGAGTNNNLLAVTKTGSGTFTLVAPLITGRSG